MNFRRNVLCTAIATALTATILAGCNSGDAIPTASAAPSPREGLITPKLAQNVIHGGAPDGSIVEAFGDNGSYYQTTAHSDTAGDLASFSLPVPTNLGVRLVVRVNPDTPDEVVVPIAFRNSRNDVENRFEIGESDHVDLGYLAVPASRQEASGYWDKDGDGKFETPFIVDDFGANNPLTQADADGDQIDDWNDPDGGGYRFSATTPDPLDNDRDGIISPYDADYDPNLVTPDIDHDGLKDNRDDANVGNKPGGNRQLPNDHDRDGYEDSDTDHNGIPDFAQDNHSPSGYRSDQPGHAQDASGNTSSPDLSGTTDYGELGDIASSGDSSDTSAANDNNGWQDHSHPNDDNGQSDHSHADENNQPWNDSAKADAEKDAAEKARKERARAENNSRHDESRDHGGGYENGHRQNGSRDHGDHEDHSNHDDGGPHGEWGDDHSDHDRDHDGGDH